MTAPYFSVIVPVYNAGADIDTTVASVLAQTDSDFELIMVDDGSTDDSLARMLRLAGDDLRVRVVSTRNGGVARARNLGAELARGKLIAFLDADDIWHPEKLSCHRALHEARPRTNCSYARIAFLETAMTSLHAARTLSSVPAGFLRLQQILAENPVCTMSNLVVDRAAFERIGGFRDGLNHAEDQEWLARALANGATIRGLQALLVGYRFSPGGLSSDLWAMYRGWRGFARDYSDRCDVDEAEAVFCRYLARRALRSGASPRLALRFALTGLRRSASAFMRDRRRGALTLAGAVTGAFLPRRARTQLFA